LAKVNSQKKNLNITCRFSAKGVEVMKKNFKPPQRTKFSGRDLVKDIEAADMEFKGVDTGRFFNHALVLAPIRPKEVKELRHKLGLTQNKLANLLGVSLATVKSWEGGARTPDPLATRVLRFLNKKPDLMIAFSGFA
jgi:DNA-binding transcriptional regulator YiaG